MVRDPWQPSLPTSMLRVSQEGGREGRYHIMFKQLQWTSNVLCISRNEEAGTSSMFSTGGVAALLPWKQSPCAIIIPHKGDMEQTS